MMSTNGCRSVVVALTALCVQDPQPSSVTSSPRSSYPEISGFIVTRGACSIRSPGSANKRRRKMSVSCSAMCAPGHRWGPSPKDRPCGYAPVGHRPVRTHGTRSDAHAGRIQVGRAHRHVDQLTGRDGDRAVGARDLHIGDGAPLQVAHHRLQSQQLVQDGVPLGLGGHEVAGLQGRRGEEVPGDDVDELAGGHHAGRPEW